MKNIHDKYTRCRLHGGASTGPRTPEGKARAAASHLKHGRYAKSTLAAHRRLAVLRREGQSIADRTGARWDNIMDAVEIVVRAQISGQVDNPSIAMVASHLMEWLHQ